MINIFGSNNSEVGTLSENLILNTAGKVKIRFGQKFVDLLDNNGNINVSIPKVITKVKSLDQMTTTGFYLLDDNLYVNVDGNIILITGVEGNFVSYAIEQNLTLELITQVQKNIGLTFSSIKEAQKAVTKGIVFVEGKMYFISEGKVKEIPLNEPLLGINNAELEDHPQQNRSAILWVDAKWQYVPVVTRAEFEKYKEEQYDDKEEDDEEETEEDSSFDPIQYSNVYTLTNFGLNIENNVITQANFNTQPTCKLLEKDICIISVNGFYTKIKEATGDNGETYYALDPELETIKTVVEFDSSEFMMEGKVSTDLIKAYMDDYQILEYPVIDNDRQTVTFTITTQQPCGDIYTFNLRYSGGNLIFINKQGENIEYPIREMTYNDVEYFVINLDLDNTFAKNNFAFKKTAFNKKNLYVKAETQNPKKFKIDYEHAEIALEENYPTNGTEEKPDTPKIIPHTVLGDLDDKSEYYNSPSKSFRTFKDKTNSLGLFSDLAVFNGAEFRLNLDYKEPETPENPEEEIQYEDIPTYNFPRYSKILNEILCNNHKLEDFAEENEPFDDVIPSIKWIRNNSALNEPLQTINNTKFPEETEKVLDYDNNEVPIAIVRVGKTWLYMHVVPWKVFKACCDEMKEQSKTFTVNWYDIKDEQKKLLVAQTTVSNNTTAVPPATNPTRKHFSFNSWDYDGTAITKETDIYAKWDYVPPVVHITCDPSAVENTGGDVVVSYYVEWDGEIITDDIVVEGSYSNIDYKENGDPKIESDKISRTLTIKESTYSTLGKINFTATYKKTELDENGVGYPFSTGTATLQQYPAGALSLPDFDLMKFTANWTNTTSTDMTGVDGWTKSGDSWTYKTEGDLDIYVHTENTNISITDDKTLDQMGAGFVGNKYFSQILVYRDPLSDSYSYINSTIPIYVRKNVTKIFDTNDNEVTEATIEDYNLNKHTDSQGNLSPIAADTGKDVYRMYQYLVWSGDNTRSGGEYIVLNLRKILNNIVKSGQKAIFIYMQFSWATSYNGTGNFDISYDLYKLNDEEKGLLSQKNKYDFTPEDSSVTQLSLTDNKLEGLCLNEPAKLRLLAEYKDPLATLYYDLNTQKITFLKGYYTKDDIYGSSSSDSTFTWE